MKSATEERDNIIIGSLYYPCVYPVCIDLMKWEMDDTSRNGWEESGAMRRKDAMAMILLEEPPTVKKRTPSTTADGVVKGSDDDEKGSELKYEMRLYGKGERMKGGMNEG